MTPIVMHYEPRRCLKAEIAECAALLLGRVAGALEQLANDQGCMVKYNPKVVDALSAAETLRIRNEGAFRDEVIGAVKMGHTYDCGVLRLHWHSDSLKIERGVQ